MRKQKIIEFGDIRDLGRVLTLRAPRKGEKGVAYIPASGEGPRHLALVPYKQIKGMETYSDQGVILRLRFAKRDGGEYDGVRLLATSYNESFNPRKSQWTKGGYKFLGYELSGA